MATINLFGAGGHAKVIKDIVDCQGDAVGMFYDDSPHVESIHGVKVCRTADAEIVPPLIIAIGSNAVRQKLAERYAALPFARAIHPSAIISSTAQIGEGTVVMQGAIIQTDAAIGRHCIINTGATVDHECRIADYVHISPNATLCGNVHVGEGSWIGAGSTVIPGIKIGRNVVVGAGAVVVRDIPDGVVAYGNPCRPHNKL